MAKSFIFFPVFCKNRISGGKIIGDRAINVRPFRDCAELRLREGAHEPPLPVEEKQLQPAAALEKGERLFDGAERRQGDAAHLHAAAQARGPVVADALVAAILAAEAPFQHAGGEEEDGGAP